VPSPQPIRAGILAVLVPIAFAGSSLQQLWEVRLSEKLAEPAGWTAAIGHPIIALAFSPDGKRLAATMDSHYQDRVQKTHLLIVDVQSPQAAFRQFDLETCGKYLAWSPGGDALLVCGRILRLADGSSCDLLETPHQRAARELGNVVFWFTSDRAIRANRTITDLSCQSVDTWPMEENWFVAGTVPEKGWMLLRQSLSGTVEGRTFPFRDHDYAIADRDSHTLTSGMLLEAAFRDFNSRDFHSIMAQGAAMFCSQLTPAGGYKSALRCWNLPEGQVIPLPSELSNHGIVQAARSSPRVVAERMGNRTFTLGEAAPELLGLMVVDLRSGKRIATLKPHSQQRRYSLSGDRYFQHALSPSGDLLAEGGDGSLRLYRLP
jgi:WD40 repeat protein